MAVTQIKDGYQGGSDNQLKVNADGSINVNTSGGGGGSNVNLTLVGGAAIALGQFPMAQSLPVVIASDQTPLPIAGTISGTVTSQLAGLTAWKTSQQSVTTTPTQLAAIPLANRSSMQVKVITTGGNIVYVGPDNTVSSTTGFPLFNGDGLQMDLTGSGQIWAVSSGGTQTVAIMEIG